MARGRQYYSRTDYFLRAAWTLARPAFRWSPRLCYGFRSLLLRMLGGRIAAGAQVFPSARITFPWNLRVGARSVIGWDVRVYNLGVVEIGERVVISQNAHLCAGTHDYETTGFPLIKREIWIEDDVWIAADAFIGPGVRIGRGAVVGARAVVVKDVAPQSIVAGNPARVVGTRTCTTQL